MKKRPQIGCRWPVAKVKFLRSTKNWLEIMEQKPGNQISLGLCLRNERESYDSEASWKMRLLAE